jgi:hypothetical protein
MTTWNFRIIKHNLPTEPEVWFGLHEVYADKKGRIEGWTEQPILVGDSIEDIAKELNHMVDDVRRFPEAINLSEFIKRTRE